MLLSPDKNTDAVLEFRHFNMTLTYFFIINPIGVAIATALWAVKKSSEYFSLNLSSYFDWGWGKNQKDEEVWERDEILLKVDDVLVERVEGHLLVVNLVY